MVACSGLPERVRSTAGLGFLVNREDDMIENYWPLLEAEPLFELRGPGGQLWKLFANGRCDGFPSGTLVINRAAPPVHVLHAVIRKQQIPSPHVPD